MNKRRKAPLLVQSQHLVTAWPTMSDRERSLVGEMHGHYEREYTRLRGTPNQDGLAAAIHQQVDEAVANTSKVSPENASRVACRRGCSQCCRQHVTVTKPEALLLLHYARAEGVPIDWQRVQRQSQHASLARWHEQPPADWACAFLSAQGECTVYEHRPAVCRKHAVIGDPAQCDAERNPGGRVLNFVSIEAEVYTSAALTVLECGSMPAMLLKHRGGST